jgi:hypothetical protein
MFKVEFIIFVNDSGAGLSHVCGGGDLCAEVFLLVLFDDDPVLAHLLLDEQHLLDALDYEVAAGVVGALLHSCQLLVTHVLQPAVTRTQHHRHTTDLHLTHHYLVA